MSNATENQLSLASTVNVRAFGAKGDGVTDDSAAFTAAFAAGRSVVVPPGTYKIATPLTAVTGLTLQGVGRPTLKASVAGSHILGGASLANVTVDGILFEGTGSSTVPTSLVGGYAATSTGLVTFATCTDVRITNCEAYKFYNGFSAINCDRLWVTGNRVRNWLLYGVLASLCTDFTIDHNTIVGCDQAGAVNAYGVSATGDEITGASSIQQACSVSHNVIRGIPSWDGIMTHDVSGLRIVGNDIRDVRIGVDVGHVIANNKVRDIQVIGNLIESTVTNTWGVTAAVHAGILVTGFDTSNRVDTAVISNNIVKGFFKTAGMVGAGSPSHISVVFANYATVGGNAVRDGGAIISNAGVYIAGNCEAPVVTGNVLQGQMAAGGIRIASCAGGGAVVLGNTVIQTTTTDPALSVTGSTLTGADFGANGGSSTVPVSIATSTVTYASRSSGATSVADGGTINHGLVTTPSQVRLTPRVASQMASVTARGATTFTVAIKTDAGAAGTTQIVDWEAVV